MIILGIIFTILAIAYAMVFMILPPIYYKTGFGAQFYHDLLRWHTPSEGEYMSNGVNCRNVCKYCRLPIIKDSQGNWFVTRMDD